MAQIDFHTGVADKLGYACRLVRKAWRSGKAVVVTGEVVDLSRLDQLLWTFDAGEFIPHVRLRAAEPVTARLQRTPVWLADEPGQAPAREVLVNLGPQVLNGAEAGFERVIEIVATGVDEVAAGRERWRRYKAAGITPSNHAQGGAPG